MVGLYDIAAVTAGANGNNIMTLSPIDAGVSGLGTEGDGSYYLDTNGVSGNNTTILTHVEDIEAASILAAAPPALADTGSMPTALSLLASGPWTALGVFW